MPVKKMISSVQLSYRKRKVIKTILSRPQTNDGVVNVHSVDRNNIGDFYCAPHHYFEELAGSEMHILDFKRDRKDIRENFIEKVSTKSVIVGGGGLLNRGAFTRQMNLFEDLTSKNKKVVLWGIGHNSKDPKSFGNIGSYNVNVSKFGIAGTRDYSMPGEYVPCVSCLHPIFDETYSETQDVGIVFHRETLKRREITEKFKDFPSTSNATNLEGLIDFIGTSNKIITDSYHAMYWGMLLGKKVVVVPNSSKFFDFKYHPVFSSFENCIRDLPKATNYPGLLEECREINHKYAEKVFDYLKV